MTADQTDPRHHPTDGPEQDRQEERDRAEAEREAIHGATEDLAPGVIKDGHAEIQPDPYPDRPDDTGDDAPDREVIEQHRADAKAIEEHRTSAANETLGTVVDHGESDADAGPEPTGG